MTSTPAPSPESRHPAPKTYADGHPLDQIHYREYKIILRPDRFASAESFHDFAKLVRHVGKELDIGLVGTDRPGDPQIREVLFYDTPAFELYNHAYMLRKRTVYRHGWPVDQSEVTLKFRHPDVNVAAAVDVRPAPRTEHRIKFKEELLGLRDKLGGMRSLFSHACVLLSPSLVLDRGLAEVASVLPAVHQLGLPAGTPFRLVNNLAIEEVLGDIGELDFGHGVTAKADVALWRNRATETPLIGEFAFQCKFERYEAMHHKALKRSADFFRAVQVTVRDWTQLGKTKTGVIYGLGSTPVKNYE